MTPADIISEARKLLNDTDPLSYRQEDAELLQYVNAAIAEAASLAPELFFATGDLTCTTGATEQTLSKADAISLVGVLRIKDGRAVPLADLGSLSAFNPDWSSDAAGPAVNWMKSVPADPLRFYIYPKSPAAQVLEVEYVKQPTIYGLTDPISDLGAETKPALANYVASRAEMKDDEHVDSGRAVSLYQLFSNFFKPQQQQGA